MSEHDGAEEASKFEMQGLQLKTLMVQQNQEGHPNPPVHKQSRGP